MLSESFRFSCGYLRANMEYSILVYMDRRSFLNIIPLLLVLLLGIGQAFAVWDGFSVQNAQKKKIDGKEYYIIDTEEKLAWFAQQVNSGKVGYNAKLTANLDMGHKLWTPIGAGNNKNNYKGVFDGDNHVIFNLYINAEELIAKYKDSTMAQNIGFIGCFSGTVRNLILEDIEVLGYGQGGLGNSNNLIEKPISIGTVVGWQSGNSSVIEGCYAVGQITTSGDGQAVGGLVGNVGGGTVRNCFSGVNIDANGLAYVGGIAGYTKNFGNNGVVKVSSCVYAGESLVSNGDGAVGAIVGHQYKGNVSFSDLYYDEDLFDEGIGQTTKGGNTKGHTDGVEDVNAEEVVCSLNGGTLVDGVCDKTSPWSVGLNSLVLNGHGADGYKIVFDANGGTFAAGATTVKYRTSGQKITADEIGTPAFSGKSFAGWSLSASATKADVDLGVAAGPTTVYAVWDPTFEITFNVAPGAFPSEGVSEKTKRVAKDSAITVEGIEPLPTSYCVGEVVDGECDQLAYFAGWALNPNASVDSAVDLNTLSVVATEDMSLYAVWVAEVVYTVTFHAEGHGKTKVSFVKVKAGETTTAPEDPTADIGYAFEGWYTDAGVKFDFDTTSIVESIVLHAHWSLTEFSIDYVLDGGENDPLNPSTYTIEDKDIVLLAPTKDGADFDSWYYDSEKTNRATQISTGTTGNKTLYAGWTVKTYEIKYNAGANGSGLVPAEKKTHDVDYTLRGVSYTRKGYGQDGWSLSDGGEKVYELGATYTENAGLVLYPHWVEGLIKVERFGGVTVYEYENHNEVVIDGSSMEEIDIPESFTATSVVYERTFEIGAYSTLVLPFSIDVEKVDGATFYALAGVVKGDDGKWKNVAVYEVETGMLEANTPYIVVAKSKSLTFEGSVQFESTRNAEPVVVKNDDGSRWVFKPTYQKLVFGDLDEYGRAYGFAAEARDGAHIGKFVKAGAKAWMRPMRAYLVYEPATDNSTEANSAGKSASLTLSDEMEVYVQEKQAGTAERTVLNARRGVVRMDRWYDLQGRKLNGKPETRGTYYHNGKRVIVK